MGICLPLGTQRLQGFGSILCCHFHQIPLLTFLRHEQFYFLAAAPRAQPLRDDDALFNFLRQHHLFGDVRRFGIELLHEFRHHLGIGGIFRAFEDEVFAPDQLAATDEEDLHAGFSVCASHSQHIRIQIIRPEDHLLPFDDGLNGFQLVTQRGGSFKAHLVCGFLHFVLHACDDLIAVPAEKVHQVRDHLAVAFLRNRSNAGRVAKLNIVIKAGAFVLSCDLAVACQIGENLAQHFQRLVHGPCRSVWPEVARTIFCHLACDGDLRERLTPTDFYVRVTLVIFEADVVFGSVLLDEVHLKDERLKFRAYDDPFNINNVTHQSTGLCIVARIRVEI